MDRPIVVSTSLAAYPVCNEARALPRGSSAADGRR
jgi:hypothetical protein